MVRAVTRMSTNTMRTGTVVHANSIGLLPYTCGGSRASSPGRTRKRMMAYASRPPTIRKITALIAMTKNATMLISWAGVETASKTLLGGIFEFDSPIPQSFASAAAGLQPITAIVKHQRCISTYKIFAADLRTISEERRCLLRLSMGTFHVKRRQREPSGLEVIEGSFVGNWYG